MSYNYQAHINKQEEFDRDICIRMIKNILNRRYNLIEAKSLPLNCPVDLLFTVQDTETGIIRNILIEVKTRNKDERQLKLYPWAEIKIEKVKSMYCVKAQYQNPSLFYAVILNNKDFYLYDMDSIDYSKINIVDWNIKKTQFNPESGRATYKIFQLPFNLAKHADIEETLEKTPPLF